MIHTFSSLMKILAMPSECTKWVNPWVKWDNPFMSKPNSLILCGVRRSLYGTLSHTKSLPFFFFFSFFFSQSYEPSPSYVGLPAPCTFVPISRDMPTTCAFVPTLEIFVQAHVMNLCPLLA
jgi:hypothetical protein